MARSTHEARIAQARLILSADAEVSSAQPYKLPQWLVTMLNTALGDLETKHQAVGVIEGARRSNSTEAQRAYDEAEGLLRDVNNYIGGLPRALDQEAIRSHYDLADGMSGSLTQGEVETHLRTVLAASATATPADAQLRPGTLAAITEVLARIDAHKPGAQSGERQRAIDIRDIASEMADDTISRVWHHLAASLPHGVFDGQMTNYGFTPRQPRGSDSAASTPPDAPPPTA